MSTFADLRRNLTFPRRPPGAAGGQDEAGVSLVLALVMLIVLSFIFLAIARSSITDIANSSNLTSQTSTEYAATGATQMAVQTVRYSGDGFAQGAASNCWGSAPPSIVINGVSMTVDCEQDAYNQSLSNTRVIDFYACSASEAPCSSTNALLYANVSFDDYSLGGQLNCTPPTNISTCGASEHINSWIPESGNDG